MKFAYSPDGQEVRLNQAGVAPMLTGNCENHDRVWGMRNEYYTAPDGVLTPMTQEEVDALKLSSDRVEAYNKMINDISDRGDSENAKPFPYTVDTVNYLFVSDKNAIQGTKNDVMADVDKTVPIRTFRGTPNEGTWKCTDETGDIVYVPFTIEEFIAFSDEYYLRWSDNFTTYDNHLVELKAVMDDETKTVEDILTYDFSIGWV